MPKTKTRKNVKNKKATESDSKKSAVKDSMYTIRMPLDIVEAARSIGPDKVRKAIINAIKRHG